MAFIQSRDWRKASEMFVTRLISRIFMVVECVVLVVCALAVTPCVLGAGLDRRHLQIEGEIETHAFRSGNSKPVVEYRKPFKIAVSGDKWRIEISTETRASIAWHDGTNVYEYVEYKASDLGLAFITKGSYPTDLDWDKRSVWLAYAMPHEFFGRSNIYLPGVLGSVRSDIEPNICVWDAEWRPEDAVGPSKVEFSFRSAAFLDHITNLTLWPVGETLRERDIEIERMHNRYNEGQLMAVFAVSESTNFHSLSVPTRWKIEQKFPKQVNAEYLVFGSVTSLKERVGPIDMTPQRPTKVADMRFRNPQAGINQVSYNVQPGKGLAEHGIVEQPVGNKDYFLRSPNTQKSRAYILTLIAVISAAPILYWLTTKNKT